MTKVEELEEFLGKEKSIEFMKLCKNYDNYVKKYKQKVNSILETVNYEVHIGHSFMPLPKEEEG